MPRSIWSGSISFGLVNVPVKLHTATEEKDISFHQFHEGTGNRIRYKRIDEDTGREVDYEDIVKGYEVSKGKFVIVTPDELETVEPNQNRTIEIEDFVDLDEIDPIYFAKTYYVVPDRGEGASKAYALLRHVMQKSNRVAIGRFVMRTKQYLVAIRPIDDVLALTTLLFSDEVRDRTELEVPGKLKLNDRETDIAMRLVDSLTTQWKPDRYTDTYRERVLELVKAKAKGKEIVVEPGDKPTPVTDLLAALEASVKEARGRRSPRASARRSSSSRKAPAAKKKSAAKRSGATKGTAQRRSA